MCATKGEAKRPAPCAPERAADAARQARGPIAGLALALLWIYKRTLSPALYVLGVRCRHLPSCSDYAADAYRLHGAWRGSWLTFARLSRCHPWGSSGWDPTPTTLADAGARPWRYGDWAWTERSARPD